MSLIYFAHMCVCVCGGEGLGRGTPGSRENTCTRRTPPSLEHTQPGNVGNGGVGVGRQQNIAGYIHTCYLCVCVESVCV